jgi:hypothetical protein
MSDGVWMAHDRSRDGIDWMMREYAWSGSFKRANLAYLGHHDDSSYSDS